MIEMGKKYKYRNGEAARILCVDRQDKYPVVSMTQNGALIGHSEDGACNLYNENIHDLIEVSEWDGFKIDDTVMVKTNFGSTWYRGYFAGVSCDGKPQTYYSGSTKWSSGGGVVKWDCCRRTTEEELK